MSNIGPQTGMPQREKYWEERNADERIQALRETVVILSRQLQEANRQVAELMRHHHAPDGSLLAPMRNHGANDAMGYSYDPAHRLLLSPERQRT